MDIKPAPSSMCHPDHVTLSCAQQAPWWPARALSPVVRSPELTGIWGDITAPGLVHHRHGWSCLRGQNRVSRGPWGEAAGCVQGAGLLRMGFGSGHEAAPSSQAVVLAGTLSSGDNVSWGPPPFWRGDREQRAPEGGDSHPAWKPAAAVGRLGLGRGFSLPMPWGPWAGQACLPHDKAPRLSASSVCGRWGPPRSRRRRLSPIGSPDAQTCRRAGQLGHGPHITCRGRR